MKKRPEKGAVPETKKAVARFRLGPWGGFALAYSGAMLLLLLPLLLKIFEPIWDGLDFFLPSFTYLADSVREMRFPLWDPYTNCGYPFHADPQNYTLNPLALLFSLLFDSTWLGFNCFWAFHWWLGGLGMMWLARQFGCTPEGGFAAAISYALSGFFLAHAEHTSYIMVAGWLPWAFFCAERALQRSSYYYALLGGAALGFSSYGGYPVLILFSCLAIAIWLSLRYLPHNSFAGSSAPFAARAVRVAATMAILSLVLILVWSPVLHAFLVEGGGYTDRVQPLSFEDANFGSPFTFTSAVTLFFPYAAFTGRAVMGVDISMVNAYMGMLTLPFAIFWAQRVGLRRCWWLFAFVLFMFLVSLGGKYGLRTLLYHVFPPMRYMRFSAPFRLFWILPLCLAAGMGVSEFLRNPSGRRSLFWTLLCWALCSAGAATAFGMLAGQKGIPFMDDFSRLFLPAIGVLGLGVALVWVVARKVEVGTASLAGYLLACLVLGDMALHLYNNSGTVWVRPDRATILESYHQRSTLVGATPAARIPGKPFQSANAQQVFKKPLVQGYMTMLSRDFDQVLTQSRYAEILGAPYRFWLSPGVEVPPSRDAALSALSATGSGAAVPVFVEREIAGLPAERVVPGEMGAVLVRSYAPERIEMEVEVPGSTGALLASTERHAAGWKVSVDGAPQTAYKVNLFFRGVFVPPGRHSVLWLYDPQYWRALVATSNAVLLLSMILGVRGVLRAGRTEPAA